jgi:hypothetical protein
MDELTLHELLDRSLMVAEIFDEHIVGHPAAQHPDLREYISKLGDDLFGLYTKVAGAEEL